MTALRATWNERRARSLCFQVLLTSYLVGGLVAGILVTAFDHHGAERNPAHSHLLAPGEQLPPHQHSFQLPHVHPTGTLHADGPAAPDRSWSPNVESADVGRTPVAVAEPPLVSLHESASPFALGVPTTWLLPIAIFAIWAIRRSEAQLSDQVILTPPLRPPARRSR